MVHNSPPTTITSTRLRTVNDTFAKVLDKDRDLLAAIKQRALRRIALVVWFPSLTLRVCAVVARHQETQRELLRLQEDIKSKKQKVIDYAGQLRRSQEVRSIAFFGQNTG